MGREEKSRKRRSSRSSSPEEEERRKHRKRKHDREEEEEEEDKEDKKRRRKERVRKREKSSKHGRTSEEKEKKPKDEHRHRKKVTDSDFKELSDEDYFSKNNEFATWLKEEKSIYFSDLSSESARDLFSSFIKKWNSRKLEPRYYEGISSGPRSAHRWKIKA